MDKQKYRILALDQATLTGWAVSKSNYGIWDLKVKRGESTGMKLIRFQKFLTDKISEENINLVVYEREAGRNKNAVILSSKLVSVLEVYCERNGINYRAYSAKEIKKFAAGNGNVNKEVMLLAAEEKYGYKGLDDNIADALHLWHLANSDYNS